MLRVLCLCLLAACSAPFVFAETSHEGSDPRTRSCSTSGVYNEIIFLCGVIDQAMLQVAEENLILHGQNRVILESSGGQPVIASRIGQLLHRNQSKVLVGRRCYSACAQLLLMAPNLTVMPWTEIGFHHNSIAYRAVKDELDESGVEYDWRPIEITASLTEFAFELVGANPDILLGGLERLGLECREEAIVQDIDGSDALVGFRYRAKHEFWIPTRAELDGARSTPIKGWWPSSWLDVAASTIRNQSAIHPFAISYGNQTRFRGSAFKITNICD